MRQVLHWGLLQGREPVGPETCVHNELAEVGVFLSDRVGGGVGKEVLGWGIQGDYVETSPKETLKARIVSGDQTQLVGVLGQARWVGLVEAME